MIKSKNVSQDSESYLQLKNQYSEYKTHYKYGSHERIKEILSLPHNQSYAKVNDLLNEGDVVDSCQVKYKRYKNTIRTKLWHELPTGYYQWTKRKVFSNRMKFKIIDELKSLSCSVKFAQIRRSEVDKIRLFINLVEKVEITPLKTYPYNIKRHISEKMLPMMIRVANKPKEEKFSKRKIFENSILSEKVNILDLSLNDFHEKINQEWREIKRTKNIGYDILKTMLNPPLKLNEKNDILISPLWHESLIGYNRWTGRKLLNRSKLIEIKGRLVPTGLTMPCPKKVEYNKKTRTFKFSYYNQGSDGGPYNPKSRTYNIKGYDPNPKQFKPPTTWEKGFPLIFDNYKESDAIVWHFILSAWKPAHPEWFKLISKVRMGKNPNGGKYLYKQYDDKKQRKKMKLFNGVVSFNDLKTVNEEKFDKIKSTNNDITHSEAAWNLFQELTGVDGYEYKYYTQEGFHQAKYNKTLRLNGIQFDESRISKKEGITWERNYHKALRRMLAFHLTKLYHHKQYKSIKRLVMVCRNKLPNFKWNNKIRVDFEEVNEWIAWKKLLRSKKALTGTNLNLKKPWIPKNFNFYIWNNHFLFYSFFDNLRCVDYIFSHEDENFKSINDKKRISLIPWQFEGFPTHLRGMNYDLEKEKNSWGYRKATWVDDFKEKTMVKSNIIYPYSLIIEIGGLSLFSSVSDMGSYIIEDVNL